MIRQILDLHIHSRYSRACSRDLELPKIAQACEKKGIDIIATGDFTHPAWFSHLKENLKEIADTGIFELKNKQSKTKFILGTEIACIKKHKDFCRRLHLCIFAPNLQIVEKFNNELEKNGFNLRSDGRPILGMTAKELLIFIKKIDSRMQMIPAHIWTPWFGLFGSKSGYDSIEDCFEEMSSEIFALETGLSSDPLMNWHWSSLDKFSLVSNSDAHSLQKLGREANVFQFINEQDINYNEIFSILKKRDKKKFLKTIEFYPEEGKYHFDGHKDCNFVCSPEESLKYKNICPICKKKLVLGVSNRLAELSDRGEKEIQNISKEKIPFQNLVPLIEIIADTLEKGVVSKIVLNTYENLLKNIGNEFYILLEADLEKIKKIESEKIAEAIDRVRKGNIFVKPGYDGVFGIVKVFSDEKRKDKNLSLEL
ncbi:MAG: endonuclease Q family protein [Patescibacteria group bacterium]